MTQIANQVAEAKEMGFADVLSKPLRKRQVLRSLSQAGSPGTSQANAVQQVKEPPAQATTAGRASILLVEDNTVNRQIAAYYLKRLGFDIEIAENGLVAVEAFERGQFDLILMDCHMPVMDGVTATKRIREMAGAGATIPILAVTADVFQDQRTRCLDAGMNDFLYKPITHEILKSKIECWLQVSSNHTS
jgi:CheY-like chemotaxis protein